MPSDNIKNPAPNSGFTVAEEADAKLTANECLALGDKFYIANEVDINYEKALYYYRLAAEQADSEALSKIGQLYEKGHGVAKDFAIATAYYAQAAKQSNATGQYNLGRMYFYGNGITKNENVAAYWLQKATDQNHVQAKKLLRIVNACNLNLKVISEFEVTKALSVIPEALTEAILFLSATELFELADKEKHSNYARAVKYYRLAAAQNHVGAQYNLGLMYKNGWCVIKDEQTAIYYFRLAAMQDNAYAQYILGSMYSDDCGVEKNDIKALYWYRQAAKKDFKTEFISAKSKLEILYSRAPHLRHMTDEECLFIMNKPAVIDISIHKKSQLRVFESLGKISDSMHRLQQLAEPLTKTQQTLSTTPSTTSSAGTALRARWNAIKIQLQPLYQQQTQIDQQLNTIETDYQNSPSANTVSQAQLTLSSNELSQLRNQAAALAQLRKAQIKKVEKLQEIAQRPKVWEFYRTIQQRFEELLLATKTVTSGMIKPDDTGKLGQTAQVIQLVGQAISLLPAVGSIPGKVVTAVGKVAQTVAEQRRKNILSRISSYVTLAESQALGEAIAFTLATRYRPQIQLLATLDELEATRTGRPWEQQVKLTLQQGRDTMLQQTPKSPAVQVAEYAVLLMWEYWLDTDFDPQQDMVSQLLKAIISSPSRTRQLSDALSTHLGSHHLPTVHEQDWNLLGFYQLPGIVLSNGARYAGNRCRADLYGYRHGELHEVEALGLELLDQKTIVQPTPADSGSRAGSDVDSDGELTMAAAELIQSNVLPGAVVSTAAINVTTNITKGSPPTSSDTALSRVDSGIGKEVASVDDLKIVSDKFEALKTKVDQLSRSSSTSSPLMTSVEVNAGSSQVSLQISQNQSGFFRNNHSDSQKLIILEERTRRLEQEIYFLRGNLHQDQPPAEDTAARQELLARTGQDDKNKPQLL